MPPSIYTYVTEEEAKFQTDDIQVGDNWYWSFRNHVQLIFHLKNGVFFTGENNWLRAFKNIMEPILSLSYWTEDIEVKDVVFYIEEVEEKILSFLIKKYHDEVYVKEHDLDSLFDEITESDIDYGGVLVQKGVEMPEVLKLKRIAFCDQTDLLGGPVAFKYFFSPSKLREMSKFGWGEESNGATISLDELCLLATADKDSNTIGNRKNKVPGKTIEAYIIRGNMPEHYLEDNDDMEYQCNQLQIVAFYTKKDNTKEGVTLYRKKEDEGNLKFFTSKEVEDRALGRGVGETLLHPQIWTNFLTIHKMNMLEASSKVPLYTDDESYTTKNKIQDMENLEITTIQEGRKIYQVPTAAPANIQLLDRTIDEFFAFAKDAGAAQDPIMGKESPSGTTFRGQERSVAQAKGSHDRRRGKRAKFIEEIYREWIIPDMKKEILKGKEFLATLSTKDLAWISDQIITNVVNQHIKDTILSGGIITPEQQAQVTDSLKQQFAKKGNKHILEILKEDFKDIEIKIGINVANKQKDLSGMTDKLLSVFQTIVANPYIIKAPPIEELFNQIIELSGLQPVDLSGLNIPPMPQRRITEGIDYKDLATPPNEIQKEFLSMAGIQTNSQFSSPQPQITK